MYTQVYPLDSYYQDCLYSPSSSTMSMSDASPDPSPAADPPAAAPPPPPPTLSFHRPNNGEKIPALTLIASSIAQQRQIFIHHLTLHPYILPPYLIFVLFISQQFYRGPGSLPTVLMITCGFAVAALTLAKRLGERYLDEAGRVRSMGLTWWDQGNKRDGLVANFGGKVVGVIAWDVVGKDEVGIVAWTVMLKYRRRGLGKDLLAKFVTDVRKKYGKGVKVGFKRDHANSLRVFESMTFHRDDVSRDKKAKTLLDSVLKNEK